MVSYLKVCLLLGVVAGSFGQDIYSTIGQGAFDYPRSAAVPDSEPFPIEENEEPNEFLADDFVTSVQDVPNIFTEIVNGQDANEENGYELNAAGQNSYDFDPVETEQNAGVPNSVQYAIPQDNFGENAFLNSYGPNSRNLYGQSSYRQNVFGLNAFGQNANGQNANEQNSYSQNAYGQNTNGQNSYSQNAYGQNNNGQNAYGQNNYAQNTYNTPNNFNQYANVPNYNGQYSQNRYGQNAYASSSAQASASASSQYYDEVLGFRVYRPCPDLNIDCIRNYFAANGQCNRASGSIPNRLYQQVSNYYYPSINMSLSQIGNVISGLNGTVNNFYVNPTTGITLLSVDYDPMTIVTDANRFLYHLNGVEPVEQGRPIDFPGGQNLTDCGGAPGQNQ